MLKFTIPGELASKSNSRKIVLRGRFPRVIKSEKALNYEYNSIPIIKKALGSRGELLGYIKLKVDVYYASKRPDLDVSLLQDVLEKAGVYHNDRQIITIEARKFWSKNNPRCEVEISEIEAH